MARSFADRRDQRNREHLALHYQQALARLGYHSPSPRPETAARHPPQDPRPATPDQAA
jgi:hypothetical protein